MKPRRPLTSKPFASLLRGRRSSAGAEEAKRKEPPRVARAPQPATPSPEDERRLFAAAMRGVRPLAGGPTRLNPLLVPARPPPPRPRRERGAARSPSAAFTLEPQGEAIEGWAAGVPRERARALRRGEHLPEARLDLHGARAEEAGRRLDAFLQAAHLVGRECVIVIHGKGLRSGAEGPILRGVVIERLTDGALSPHVLAFASAPTRLGGFGALLVLLRR